MLDIVPTIGVAQLMENPDFTIVQTPGTSWNGLAMNYTRPPWDNPDARMAVAKAINREALIETAFFGLSNPSIGAIAPAFAWAYIPPEETETPQAFNLEEAKALAEAAGIVGAAPTIMATSRHAAPRRVPSQPAQRYRARRSVRATPGRCLERALAGRRL